MMAYKFSVRFYADLSMQNDVTIEYIDKNNRIIKE